MSPDAQNVATALLQRIPPDVQTIGVEIGVYRAGLSEVLLDARPNLTLVMVDSWSAESANPEYAKTGDLHAIMPQPAHDEWYAECVKRVQPYRNRAIILRARSWDVGMLWQKQSLDFVFIDADHSYQGCSQDIYAWRDKIVQGGFISGHDYENPNYPQFGVKRAVDEAFGAKVVLGEFMTWFVHL